MVAAVMEHLGVKACQDHEVEEIMQDIAPEAVLHELEQQGTGAWRSSQGPSAESPSLRCGN